MFFSLIGWPWLTCRTILLMILHYFSRSLYLKNPRQAYRRGSERRPSQATNGCLRARFGVRLRFFCSNSSRRKVKVSKKVRDAKPNRRYQPKITLVDVSQTLFYPNHVPSRPTFCLLSIIFLEIIRFNFLPYITKILKAFIK